MNQIQNDTVGFANSLSQAVEDGYHWRSDRGLEIVKAVLIAVEYDEDTKALLSDVRRADGLAGARGNSFLQQSVARGVQAAGENPNGGGAMGMAFMGMGMNAAGSMAQGLQQQPVQAGGVPYSAVPANVVGAGVAPQAAPDQGFRFDPHTGQPLQPQVAPAPVAAPVAAQGADASEDPYVKLTKLKGLLDAGVISQSDFDAAKNKLLGL
jgi:membrane protease subunit (stomatin/prohibitin family)